jgi:hypothetical protein
MTNEIKLVFNNPWAGVNGEWAKSNPVGNEADAYAKVPLVYRAMQLRCDVLSGVPLYIYDDNDKELDEYWFEESLPLSDLIWKSEAALLLRGSSIILKQKNAYEIKKGLQWINPFTVMYEYKNGQLYFWQETINGERYPRNKDFWTVDDFLYFREFNPLDDLGWGTSAASVALGNAQIGSGVTTFLSKYFGADAVPITMVGLPAGTQPAEVSRIEKWFKDKIRNLGGKKSERVIGTSGEVTVTKLTETMETYDFATIDTHALQGVSDAFKIPQSLLRADSGANRAISDNEMRSFLQKTIVPRCKYFERVINPFLAEFGQRIEFAPNEMTEMQPDEVQRADALGKLKQAGIPLLAALDMMGYEPSEDAMRMIEEAVAKAEETANRIANAPKPVVPGQPKPGEEDPNAEDPEKDDEPIKAELDKWFRKAQKAYDKKGTALVEFESDVIPQGVKDKVSAMLSGKSYMDSLKIGARNSSEDSKRIQTVHDLAKEMGAGCVETKANTMSGIVQLIHDHSTKLGARCASGV